jgi:hypothetical protein
LSDVEPIEEAAHWGTAADTLGRVFPTDDVLPAIATVPPEG